MTSPPNDLPWGDLQVSPEQLLHPIDFIEAQHRRQQRVCDWMQAFAESLETEPVTDQATELLKFLTEEVPLHTGDEEAGLFPLLRQRCRAEDGIDHILAQLSREHELDQDLVEFLVEDLKAMATAVRVPNLTRFFVNVRAFVETQRRHLEWENAIILPLARKRLTDEDLRGLARNFAARRRLSLP